MEDPTSFFRQRLLACFHRRRKYALGSEDRAHAVKETRTFIRAYRESMKYDKANKPSPLYPSS